VTDQLRDAVGTVQEGILRMRVEMNEWHELGGSAARQLGDSPPSGSVA
jgi:hypothetical protein